MCTCSESFLLLLLFLGKMKEVPADTQKKNVGEGGYEKRKEGGEIRGGEEGGRVRE